MFYENFMRLCNERKVSPTGVMKSLGFSTATQSAWRKGATPQARMLYAIADYFDVTVDELVNGQKKTATEADDGLSEDERALIEIFRSAAPDVRQAMLTLLRSYEAGK